MRGLAWSFAVLTATAAHVIATVSYDGTCGGPNGYTCMGSVYGNCCSKNGFCGATADYCGAHCQLGFGICENTKGTPSMDGTCGGSLGYTCEGSKFGDCCSQYEFCGNSSAYCETGCNDKHGRCHPPTGHLRTRSVPPIPLRDATISCPQSNDTIYSTDNGEYYRVRCGSDDDDDVPRKFRGTDGFATCIEDCATDECCIGVSWIQGTPLGRCHLKSEVSNAASNPLMNTWNAIRVYPIFDHVTTLVSSASFSEATTMPASCVTTPSALANSNPTSTPTIIETVHTIGRRTASGSTELLSSSTSTAHTSGPEISQKISSSESSISVASSTAVLSTSISTNYTVATGTALSSKTTQSNLLTISTPSNKSPVSNATASSIVSAASRATSSPAAEESCTRCEGQPGTDQYCGYDINTNYYEYTPKTCRTVEYTLTITNTTVAPDGISRIGLLVNGQMPGPVIEANWGDTVKVTVINQLQDNGTTIHFHGIRQHDSNQYDGVPSITQCPIAPGDQMTYTWRAESYGTSWYHSHFSVQAWEGAFGPIKINGPTSASYDVDGGHIMLQDWSHRTICSQYGIAQDASVGQGGGARVMDNGLINGLNTWGVDGQSNQTGERFRMDVDPGKAYLLRIVNIGIQSTYKFYIDGHTMTVIAEDFTPIVPYDTTILNINIGQRYDVIVKADQTPSSYWMRSDNQNACAGTIQALDIRGIVHYTNAPITLTPTSTAYNYTTECVDENPALHTPIMALTAGPTDLTLDGQVTIAPENNLYRWYLSGYTFVSRWSDPTLLGIVEDGVAPTYSGNLLINAPTPDEWVYVIVQSTIGLPHPIHLHGHDFFVLAQGSGAYVDGAVPLKLDNPSRRDTVLMPGAGFVVVAWKADNPGSWLMHCHVGWHVSMGFAIQIVEQIDNINATLDDCGAGLRDTCAKWNTWANARGVYTADSGV